MPFTRIAYASNHSGLAAGVLDDIHHVSSLNNERDGITGVLVACEEDFLEILEGERTAVSACMTRVMRDTRHQKVNIIFAGDVQTCLFTAWSMHNIDRDVMLRHMENGDFDPAHITAGEIFSLCSELALTN